MLQWIRDRFTGVIAVLIIGAIGVTLVISFGNMRQGGATGNFAAKVNGEEIAVRLYQRTVQNQLARQQEALQGELPEILQQQIRQNVLEGLVRNKIVQQYVRDSGFRLDDDRMRSFIRNQSAFQVGGEFNPKSYKAVLASQGLTREYFEQEQRIQLEVRQLQDAIISSSFFTPSEYRRYIELLAEEREATIIVLDSADLVDGIAVDESALKTYYEAHPDEFRLPESVSLEYIEIQLDDVAAEVNVDEEAIRKYYNDYADLYIAEDQRQGRHILITLDDDTDEAAAQSLIDELYRRLLDGEDFATLAREYSDDRVSAEQGGDLGWASRGDYVEAFEAALFELEVDAVSSPVRSEFGFHIIRLDAIQAGALRTYDEVREEIYDELTQQMATDRFYALAERVDDLALENPTSLDVVESETGLEIQSIERFTRQGGEPFGYNAQMVGAAFSLALLEDGENSPLIETADESAVVLRVTEYRESSLQPLTEVRDRVAASIRVQQAGELAWERGQQILGRLQAGESPDDMAAEFGVEVLRPGVLTRGSNEVGAELLAEIYRTPRPVGDETTYRGISLANGGYAVFRLDKFVAGRAEAIPQEARDQRKEVLAQQNGSNTFMAVVGDLREQAKVIVAPGLLDPPESF
jgi:peptidyl-prolyl cis-trans isomerase D